MRATWIRGTMVVFASCAAPAATTSTTDTGCPQVLVYTDGDGDGYGDDATGALACEAGSDEVLVGGDCDDADPATFPGAEDAWYDGVDADCAGDDDYDADGDGVPSTAGDCDDTDPAVLPGAVDAACDGVDSDCDGLAPRCEIPFASLAGRYTGDGLGGPVAFAGDLDGDGLDDVLLGSEFSYSGAGAAYLVPGPATGALTVEDAGIEIQDPAAEGGMLGVAIAPAGDWDGDGDDDVWIGAGNYAYLLPGPLASPVTAVDLSSATATLFPTGHVTGRMLGGRDVTGEGTPDVLTNHVSGVGGSPTAVYLFAGGWTGHRDDPDLTIRSADWLCQYQWGTFHDWAGDTDGDGVEEIYIGGDCDPQYDPEGGALVPGTERGDLYVGADSGLTTFPPHLAGTAGFDSNGDGYGDVAITLPDPGLGGSTIHVLEGPLP